MSRTAQLAFEVEQMSEPDGPWDCDPAFTEEDYMNYENDMRNHQWEDQQ